MLSRRRFLLSSASALALSMHSKSVKAWYHGSAKVGQSVVNAGASSVAFINLAKGIVTGSSQANYPSACNSDGFPTSIAAMGGVNWNMAPVICDPSYFGRYYLWWTGTGNLVVTSAMIVYSGNSSCLGFTSGAGNILFGGSSATQPTSGSPIEFAFGALIGGVSSTGGLIEFSASVASSFFLLPHSGTTNFQFNNLTYNGGPFPSGPNPDGSWQCSWVDDSHITLQGSSGLNSALVGLNTSGTTGVNSEAIQSISQVSLTINSSGGVFGSISGWSNIVWCKKRDYAAVLAGQLASPDYVTAMKALNPRFIRFMDFQAIQNDRSSAYAGRCLTSNFYWGASRNDSDYYAGTITNSGSDAYTCSNPSTSPLGAYQDGEVVYGQISGANTGFAPTLNVGSRGAKPILSTSQAAGAALKNMFLTGSVPPVSTVQTFHFSGAGLVGTYSPTYTTTSGDTSLAALGGHIANQFRNDTTLQAARIIIPFNGLSVGSACCFSYNPNQGGLGASPLTVTGSDAASAVTYSFGTMNNQAGSGNVPGNLPNGYYGYFSYSALLGAWFCVLTGTTEAGFGGGVPLEFMADLCNRAGVGCYFQVGVMWSVDRIQKTVQYFAQNLNGELKIAFSNETWNAFEAEFAPCISMAGALGIINANEIGYNSLSGLRIAQISQIASAAWTGAGRSRSQLHVQLEYWNIDMASGSTSNQGNVQNRLRGALLNPGSNSTLASFGGIGTVAITTNPVTGLPYDYSTFPNRPVDLSDEIGGAPYWHGGQANAESDGSGLFTTDYNNTAITVSAYNGLLLAAYNYVYGNPTQQAAALDFLYNENSGPAGDLYNGALNGTQDISGCLALWETGGSTPSVAAIFNVGQQIASYDTARAGAGLSQLGYCCYEGDMQVGPVALGDVAPIATTLTNLGYTNGYSSALPGAAAGGPTGASDTAANAALCIAILLGGTSVVGNAVTGSPNANLTGFKNDNRYQLLTKKYLQICKNAGQWNGSSLVNRISLGTHFGFDGPNVWSFYPAQVLSTPYQSFNAYQAWNH